MIVGHAMMGRPRQYSPVKYIVVMVRGAAEMSAGAHAPSTLEAASLPQMGRLAAAGRVGCVDFGAEGDSTSAEAALLSLLGYDAAGVALPIPALAALGSGIHLGETDTVLGLHLLSVDAATGGVIAEGVRGLQEAELDTLLKDISEHWKSSVTGAEALHVHRGPRWMHLILDASTRRYRGTITASPAEVLGECWPRMLPAGEGAEFLRQLITTSMNVLASHEVNIARCEHGLRTADVAWVWGPGRVPAIVPFDKRHRMRGAVVGSNGSLVGTAMAAGMRRVEVAAGTIATDARLHAVESALRHAELALCVIDDLADIPRSDQHARISALEALDAVFLTPLLRGLEETYGNAESGGEGWRVMMISDGIHHDVASKSCRGVPFLIAGSWVVSTIRRRFTEKEACASDLQVDRGHTLMEYFLHSGVPRGRTR